MKKLKKQHEDLMRLLDEVPGVEEHMQSFEVQMGEKILERRLQAGLNITASCRDCSSTRRAYNAGHNI